jgi:hypothetical protein
MDTYCCENVAYDVRLAVWSDLSGFERVAHLRSAVLPGGDAASSYPVQASAGFLDQLDELPAVTAQPFLFDARYHDAESLVRKKMRTFPHNFDGQAV